MRSLAGALLASLLLVACSQPAAVGRVRFHNAPPVWHVDDRRDVTRPPAKREFAHLLYFFDAFFMRTLLTDSMDLETPRRAMNVNAFDEVPSSTWFTNRIGARELTVEEMRRGPNEDDGPVAPYKVTGTKVGGKSVGFVMQDARGVRYIVKFDERGFPILETAADIVVQRLLWALGYFVPEDSIFYFRRSELELAEDAVVKDVFGNERPMTLADLDADLARVDAAHDGRYRALASKFLPGKPIGGYAMRGTRPDDPNDQVPHEHRRDVRGLYAIMSWLQATDVKEDNTLDVWTSDAADPDRHYVVHYLVDFGKSLGVNGTIPRFGPDGHLPRVAPLRTIGMLLTLGLVREPWEGVPENQPRGVGHWDVAHYSPDEFSPQQPYRPFAVRDRFDDFWAVKLILELTPALIRAAVEQGRYDDPRAVDAITRTLVERQRKLAHFAFARVNPLDGFALRADGALCFDDLMLHYELAPAAGTEWSARSYDYDGASLGSGTIAPAGDGAQARACVSQVPRGTQRNRYTIVRIDTRRGARSLPPVEVHLADDPAGGGARIIGIERR